MKRPPAWLAAFHRQWLAARGRKAEGKALAFARDWESLLDVSGLKSAEDRAAAVREAEVLEREGRLVLVRHRYRRFLERVRLPLEQEAWLRGVFGTEAAGDLLARSMGVVDAARGRGHPVWPELWEEWCGQVLEDFRSGKARRPLRWQQPEVVERLLDVVWHLTAREWRTGTLVRDASVALGWDSKALERHQAAVEAVLTGLLGGAERVGLEVLGLVGSNSVLVFHGSLVLEVPGGAAEPARWLEAAASVTAADLERAATLHTTARAVLTVENSKSPFRHAVQANAAGVLLVVASSFPTRAVRMLLEKLPPDVPHYHFGDTDPAGYLILQKLRQIEPTRLVLAWEMDWRDKGDSLPLTAYDRRVAMMLLEDPLMADVHGDLRRMLEAGRKGDFEQEGRVMAGCGWPEGTTCDNRLSGAVGAESL